ncbi:hypothetical protein PAESOLCIP111_04024 [Paenibacillus solanacearum]|uniref:DUF2569 domain-containing protein n=1 Tax=Paenibacillus solanacearum TaxID=2048548 RepID=A0A916NRA5_9BACL|nr:DUF2569 family protein [Paenibacillus solanacearum]CAG7639328.1 hypothetical protein PAESOLCIP111_04024 [Paenibacillus solanacearum]
MLNNEAEELYPRPIGGWLLVYLIILVISEVMYIAGVIRIVPNFINLIEESTWIQNVIIIGTLIKTVIAGLILMLFISKKNYALRLIMIFEVSCILIRILTYIDYYSREQIIPKSYHVSILFGVISAFWILYFIKSNRAKETFINS